MTRLAITWLPTAEADVPTLVRTVAAFDGRPAGAVSVVHACRTCGSDQHGKLQVVDAGADGPGRPLHVSLSRSGDVAVVAVTDAGPVGVDVETAATRSTDLRTWVRKESVVKATGHGLQVDPGSFDVGTSDSPPALTRWPADQPTGSPVWMFDLATPQDVVAAATVLSDVRPHLVRPAEASAG